MKNIFKYIIALMGFYATSTLVAQHSPKQGPDNYLKDNEQICFSPEIICQNQESFFLNLSMGLMENGKEKRYSKNAIMGKVGADIGYIKNKFYVAPRFSFQCNINWLLLRISLSYLTDFKVQDRRLSYEAGIRFSNAIYLVYGYDVNMGEVNFPGLNQNKITMGINIGTKLEKKPKGYVSDEL